MESNKRNKKNILLNILLQQYYTKGSRSIVKTHLLTKKLTENKVITKSSISRNLKKLEDDDLISRVNDKYFLLHEINTEEIEKRYYQIVLTPSKDSTD